MAYQHLVHAIRESYDANALVFEQRLRERVGDAEVKRNVELMWAEYSKLQGPTQTEDEDPCCRRPKELE